MPFQGSLRMLVLPLALLAIVVSTVSFAPQSSAEETITVYKDAA